MKKQISLCAIACLTLFAACKKKSAPDTGIKDADGNIYTEVKIGAQTWLLENLKTTKFRNGEPIPMVTDSAQWNSLATAAFCNYENNVSNGNTEGRLYNWFAVTDSRNICPPGFHIPTSAEMLTLVNFLGGAAVAGNKLKNTGIINWGSPNTGSTNESGFTANASGVRVSIGFYHRLLLGFYWTSTNNPNPTMTNYAYYLHLQNGLAQGDVTPFLEKTGGISVRCIKD